MVFSFFKKQSDNKMPERPAARPKAAVAEPAAPVAPAAPAGRSEAPDDMLAPVDLPALEFSSSKPQAGMKAGAPASVTAAAAAPQPVNEHGDLDFTMSDFERDFTESSVMAIDVDHGGDPIQDDIEQVAVLYANGQDAAARSLLDIYIRSYPGEEGLRFWQMYFDLLQQTGDRAAFEKFGVEFAETFERSPPTWRELGRKAAPGQVAGVAILALPGVLTAEDVKLLAPLISALERKQPVSLDCSKMVGCDDEISGRLAEALASARRQKIAVRVEGAEALIARLQGRLVVGQPDHLPSWMLLLELLQRYGTQDSFEEKAVDYAVTFELSPPSWETVKAPALAPSLPVVPTDGAHYLSGELHNCRFDDLPAVFSLNDTPVLDFSGVQRLDFFSAGQLVNRLAALKAAGGEAVIRSPNHLVAELMAVVGLNKFARIVVPKS